MKISGGISKLSMVKINSRSLRGLTERIGKGSVYIETSSYESRFRLSHPMMVPFADRMKHQPTPNTRRIQSKALSDTIPLAKLRVFRKRTQLFHDPNHFFPGRFAKHVSASYLPFSCFRLAARRPGHLTSLSKSSSSKGPGNWPLKVDREGLKKLPELTRSTENSVLYCPPVET